MGKFSGYSQSTGSGAPILFIQGVGAIGRGWDKQIIDLSRDYQAIAFDNRGIGKSTNVVGSISVDSMTADARDLLDDYGIAAAHVVGHSLGGVIAQNLALIAPERVKSLSLLCTFARGKQAGLPHGRIIWLGLRSRLGTRSMRRLAFLEMLYSRSFLRNHPNWADLAVTTGGLVGRDLAESPPIIGQQLQALVASDLSSRLPNISVPTFVVSGSEDPIARPAYGKMLANLIPNAEYVEMTDSSHGLMLQEAQKTNELLRRFIAKTESGHSLEKGTSAKY